MTQPERAPSWWFRLSDWAQQILGRKLRRQVQSIPDIDTNDVVQTSLRRLWQQQDHDPDETQVAQAKLIGIARNVVNEKRRNAARQKRQPAEGNVVSLGSESGAPVHEGADRDLELRELVGRLAPDERDVLQDLYFHGYSTTESAQRRGWSKAKTSRIHTRALQQLERWLEPQPQRSWSETPSEDSSAP